jgi:Hg(II)-responsive transcriptional regulator
MSELTIGQIARRTGIGIETIRFYERKGLIDEPPRKESGYRQYDENAIARLTFIQQAKTLGFSLREINELLSLRQKPGITSREIKQVAETKLADIENKMRLLRRMQRTLKKLVDKCPGNGPTNECPILEALEKSPL